MMRLSLKLLIILPTLCQSRTNILLFIVDDMGIGDIPCYGNTSVPMENVKWLCRNGATLTHHTTPATLCTPSRAALQTGRYPIRMGMVGERNTPPVNIFTSGTDGLPTNETTIGRLAKDAGYNTGYVGKWHLGLNKYWYNDMKQSPLGHGYDYFFGLPYTLVEEFDCTDGFFTLNRCDLTTLSLIMLLALPIRLFVSRSTFFYLLILQASLSWFFLEHFRCFHKENWWGRSPYMYKFLNSYLMENSTVMEKPISLEPLALRLAKRSTDFLERASELDAPFLLVHAFAHVHDPLYTSPEFSGMSHMHGKYGDVLIETDHCLGLIMNKLRALGMEKDTLVYFTSDHGANIQLGTEGGYNGAHRGGKGNGALEGGMRIPGVIQWPGVVKPGVQIEAASSIMDILPTIADVTGSQTTHLKLDGHSLVPLLQGADTPHHQQPRILYHFCASEIFAMRLSYEGTIYKAIFKEPRLNKHGLCPGRGHLCKCYGEDIIEHHPLLVFDIVNDPSERNPINNKSGFYTQLLDIITEEKAKFKEEIDRTKMASQFKNKLAVLPHPWLQPAYLSVQYQQDD